MMVNTCYRLLIGVPLSNGRMLRDDFLFEALDIIPCRAVSDSKLMTNLMKGDALFMQLGNTSITLPSALPWHLSVGRDTRQGRLLASTTFQLHMPTRLITVWVVPFRGLRRLAEVLTA